MIRQSRRGSLLIVLILVSVLVLIMGAASTLMVGQTRQSGGHLLRSRAAYAAESGLQLALKELDDDESWGSSTTPQEILLDVSPDGKTQARLKVWSNRFGTAPLSVTGSVSVEPGEVYVEAIGVIEGRDYGTALGTARAVISKPVPFMNHAVYDEDRAIGGTVEDAWIDSYDSASEEVTSIYSWASGQPPQPSTSPPYDGRFGGGLRSPLAVNVDFPIYGDITHGAGEPVNAPQLLGSVVESTDDPLRYSFVAPSSLKSAPLSTPTFPNLAPGHYGVVNVPAGSNLILGRGEYLFESFTLGDGCDVVLAGDSTVPQTPVVIYFEDAVNFGRDTLLNMNYHDTVVAPVRPQARELQMFGVGGSGRVRIRNGTRFRGCMAGHKLVFTWPGLTGLGPSTPGTPSPAGRNGVDIFGGVHGEVIGYPHGLRFHFDKALLGTELDGNTVWILEDNT